MDLHMFISNRPINEFPFQKWFLSFHRFSKSEIQRIMMWYPSHCHDQTFRLCDGSPYRPNWRWMWHSGNKMWQVNDVNSLSTAYFQSSFVSSILLEWIVMSVRLPASAVGCQTDAEEYQNTPCMAAWPSVTHSHTPPPDLRGSEVTN